MRRLFGIHALLYAKKWVDYLLLPPSSEVWGKVIFSVACVTYSVHGGCLPQCMLGYHPPEQTPPLRSRQPPGADPPEQCMLGDAVNKQMVCILLECNLVTGFPPIREIREFRENFEDFFQSGKNRGFQPKSGKKISNQGTFSPNHFQTF